MCKLLPLCQKFFFVTFLITKLRDLSLPTKTDRISSYNNEMKNFYSAAVTKWWWLVWPSGNAVGHINEVELRRVWLVLGVVTSFGGTVTMVFIQGPDLHRILSATYELLMITGTYGKLRISAIYRESYDEFTTKAEAS